jgi:ketosteroid isomerase-like protein
LSQTNIELAKSQYAAFQRGDIASILASLTDDIEWITSGDGLPTTGTRRGAAQVAQFFESVANTWNFTVFEPREFMASGDSLAVSGHYAAIAKPTGKKMAADWLMVWKIRDGKVSYFREYTDTEALAAALTA